MDKLRETYIERLSSKYLLGVEISVNDNRNDIKSDTS